MASRSNQDTLEKDSRENDNSSLLEEFFVNELKDLYWAEKHLTKALPKLAKASTSDDLRDAFEDHLKVTEGHVSRLEQVFEMMGKKAQAQKCEAIEGITKEGETIIGETKKGTLTRDAALVMAGKKAEHYEIASYGALVELAKTLDREDVADLLQQTLEEEKEADEALSSLAQKHINQEAKEETV